MKKILSILTLVCALAFTSVAQTSTTTSDKVELYGGAVFTHLVDTPFNYNQLGLGFNYAGWEAASTFKFNKTFGITADVDGSYGTGINTFDFFVGPSVSFKTGPIQPFIHVMPGLTDVRGTKDFTGSHFALASGGGIDIPFGNHFSVRPVQLDYIYNTSNVASNSLRYSGGIVFKF